jgi:flavin reductase (DIM6/NTAB) family NADH-FMN oxidoreductase RutF
VGTPLIAECPIARECRVIHRLPLGSHDLFVGEVLAVQADEQVLNAQGGLDYQRADLLAYVGGTYWRLGERLGRYGDWKEHPR